MDTQDIGELFLINFVHAVAMSQKPSSEFKLEQPEKPFLEPPMQEKINMVKMVPASLKPVPSRPVFQNQQVSVQFQKTPLYESRSIQRANTDIPQSATEKLNLLIKDPYINEIECIGGDNPLLVKKSGLIQKTQIKLSIEDIYDVIAEFSQKTKIPVINGSIKAALNNLIITAVLSETLGPRFILQKKRPII